jgi:DNA-binding NarL/FixJ family response regulator
VTQLLHAGADAYLLKDGPSRHLIDAMNYVGDGGVYVTPLLRGVNASHHQKASASNLLSSLSPRELEVYLHLTAGLCAKDIVELLEVSPRQSIPIEPASCGN